jgi:hypothetical protein
MMGRMNKHMNRLSMRDLLNVERKEGHKSVSTKNLPSMEMKEHGLKGKPSISKIQRAEAIEHKGKQGLVSKPGKSQHMAATKAYRGR